MLFGTGQRTSFGWRIPLPWLGRFSCMRPYPCDNWLADFSVHHFLECIGWLYLGSDDYWLTLRMYATGWHGNV